MLAWQFSIILTMLSMQYVFKHVAHQPIIDANMATRPAPASPNAI